MFHLKKGNVMWENLSEVQGVFSLTRINTVISQTHNNQPSFLNLNFKFPKVL